MDSMNTEEAVSTGKKREDRGAQSKNKFDPLQLEVKYPGTAILLLQCQENTILLNAAAALAKYGAKSQENIRILFDLDIVKNIIPLIKHEDLFTRRFAAKLLAEMTIIPCVRDFLLKSNDYIPHFTKVLMNEQDIFMQEFSSLILVELSKDMYGAAQLLKNCPNMNFVYERIQSPDPDVKKNNIEIIYNLMQDLVGAQEVVSAPDFSLPLIYKLFEEPYPEIQRLALSVVGNLLARNKDEHMQNLFRETKGLEALFNFLDNDDWHDLHSEVLKILALALDNHKTVELLDSIGGTQRIYKYMEDTTNSQLFLDAFDIVVRLADTLVGRKALHLCGINDHLTNTLQGATQPEICRITCNGIGKMASYGPAVERLSTIDFLIKDTLDILKNETFPWSSRHAALFALNELLNYDKNSCENFLRLNGEIDCPTLDELKILCCNALSKLCIDTIGRDAFLKIHGPSKLHYLLSDLHSIPVRNAAVQLVQLLCADPVLANVFVQTKYLSYMLNNRASARIVPSWDTCIEALFNAHLPAKFAFTGRLSLHDITQDGFYVLRQNVCPFPVLNDIFRFKFCPLEPVYVVNISQPRSSILSNGTNANEKNMEEARNSIRRESASKGVFLSAEAINDWLEVMFGRLQPDPYLYEYIELLKCKLVALESQDYDSIIEGRGNLVKICAVASRAKMLAQFVARQMSGPDPSNTCVYHQLEVHLKEIKESIGTSVIPLGQLRVGSYLERALLFKVLADRICLPTALVRGEYGTAWVEIAIPQAEIPAEDTSFTDYLVNEGPCTDWIVRSISLSEENRSLSRKMFSNDVRQSNDESISGITIPWKLRQPIFPSRLMKPNFIVDLMEKPGRLIPIDSDVAKSYGGKEFLCDFTCSP
ncbi:hypothetical protein KPH14_001089 [Odynerus spinipes]|uniref:EDR1/CTR1/ARMC3-like peptidase-like domain-containing protein n=1 Tax=Odynerus spinipes TaxID=1348599 RepID=A0AAD9VVH6_9HYME|nr:hypothetical protein KPH14_001089 [Odynerus spinipes]